MAFYDRFFEIATEVINPSNMRRSPMTQATSAQINDKIINYKGLYRETNSFMVSTIDASHNQALTNAFRRNPALARGMQRAACVLSNVPTHNIQGTSSGEASLAFHIVTPKQSNTIQHANSNRIIHALNTYTLSSLIHPAEGTTFTANNGGASLLAKSSFGAGKLDGVTSIRDRTRRESNIELSDLDKAIMYFSQFSGVGDMYMDGGFDMWFVRNNQYPDATVQRSVQPALRALAGAFGEENCHVESMRKQVMRVKRSAEREFNQICLNPDSTNAISYINRTPVTEFGTSDNRVLSFLGAAETVAINLFDSGHPYGAERNTIFSRAIEYNSSIINHTNRNAPDGPVLWSDSEGRGLHDSLALNDRDAYLANAPQEVRDRYNTDTSQTTNDNTQQDTLTNNIETEQEPEHAQQNTNETPQEHEQDSASHAQSSTRDMNINSDAIRAAIDEAINNAANSSSEPETGHDINTDQAQQTETEHRNTEENNRRRAYNETPHSAPSENTYAPINVTGTDAELRNFRFGGTGYTSILNTFLEHAPEGANAFDFSAFAHVISDEDFKQLEKTFMIGGIEHSKRNIASQGKLLTTERSLEVLSKLRETLDGQHSFSRDTKFYEKIGTNGLPKAAFDIREYTKEQIEASAPIKKRLSLAGALVGVNGDKQTWVVDDIGYTNQFLDSQSANTNGRQADPSRFNVSEFNISDSPTPNIDFNPNNWSLLNTDMSIHDALNNGYVMPIKDSKAIFVPSFASPDMTYGVEYEAGSYASMSEVLNKVRDSFGYDLEKMNFIDRHKIVEEPSIRGQEYVTPVMSGVRAFKSTYMLAEALQQLGATETRHTDRNRNDPSGIHVNVGTIDDMDRKDAVRFAADYLRLVEDVYKKITSPDERYRYFTGTNGVPYGFAVQANSLPERESPANQFARQFWAQSMSANRRAGDTGLSEYEYYREHGQFWGQASVDPGYGEAKLPKYKTIAMNKLQLIGVTEVRSPMYKPGGSYALNQLVLASKIASDIHNGAKTGGAIGLTDKLVPPVNGWDDRTKDNFNKIIKDVFGIKTPTDQKFVWDLYNSCKGN